MSSNNPAAFQSRSRASLVALGLLALSACAGVPDKKTDTPPVTPSERYAMRVDPAPQELKLGPHASGLSPAQTDALRVFVGLWDADDRKPITIMAPEHGPPAAAVFRTAAGARDNLIAAGVPASEIQLVGYEAAGVGDAPIRISFMSYTASGPQCGRAWEDIAKTYSNESYRQFGCAVTANMAAQIADPEDLLHPRALAPSDAVRRENVLDKYRSGTVTATAKDTQANGAVSSSGQ
jgi:pilus assembly protein CpaD